MTTSELLFENAMFGGIDAVLAYYTPHIEMLSAKHEDKSRCTLNQKDLMQCCYVALHRCWKKQERRTDIKNFDMLAKGAMTNEMSTQQGKEFCHKRGRVHLVFFSELAKPEHSEQEVDVDAVLFHSEEHSYTSNESGLDLLAQQIDHHLDHPRLKQTFRTILTDHPLEFLNPDNHSQETTIDLARQLQCTPQALMDDLVNIQFILQGFRENFRGASF